MTVDRIEEILEDYGVAFTRDLAVKLHEEFTKEINNKCSKLYYSDSAVNMSGEYQGLWVRWKALEETLREE